MTPLEPFMYLAKFKSHAKSATHRVKKTSSGKTDGAWRAQPNKSLQHVILTITAAPIYCCVHVFTLAYHQRRCLTAVFWPLEAPAPPSPSPRPQTTSSVSAVSPCPLFSLNMNWFLKIKALGHDSTGEEIQADTSNSDWYRLNFRKSPAEIPSFVQFSFLNKQTNKKRPFWM